jgi:aminopeptidase N
VNVTAAEPGPGISWTLARERAARISDLRYDVALSIPESPGSPISARVSAAFALSRDVFPIVFDFEPGPGDETLRLDVNGRSMDARCVNGHLVIPAAALRSGQNVVTMAVDAGDAPLNRSGDFLYSIFVPARAHQSIPCFDQPDLKARWTLALDVPAGWEALGNGAETSRDTRGGRTRFMFAETPPLSTYLFAFAAGRLSIERATRGGRVFRVLHRETGDDLARNLDSIVALHTASLEWLERYTDIPYPFGKFDLLLVPAFQFSGMEHPGAIFYNASSLLLDASATRTQQLDRAALIAHETAHIWFGDLVTMPWFDDVWVKEVFANVMAGKIMTDVFPDVNHDLRFLHAHYPPAFDIDRTDGTNPIRQPLDNLSTTSRTPARSTARSSITRRRS